MDAVTEPGAEVKLRKRRFVITPAIEFGVIAIAAAVALGTWFAISGDSGQRLLTPPLVALLLVSNLLPGVALLVLIGRRIARKRSASAGMGGGSGLHVRLVAIFSVLAAVPVLLVTLVSSLLFQYGVEFWFSDRARGMLENAQSLALYSHQQLLKDVGNHTSAMAGDLAEGMQEAPVDSLEYREFFARQVYYRSLSEAVIFSLQPNGTISTVAVVNPYERDLAKEIDPRLLKNLQADDEPATSASGERIRALAKLPGNGNLYLYAGRLSDLGEVSAQTARAQAVMSDYRALLERSRSLQLQFNGALLAISLLIVGIAVWVAIAVADRLVRPISELVGAARGVAGGDLAVRVPEPKAQDELGVLAGAFNQMTVRLQQQTGALVAANAQSESRRALIEAVMSGVSAGVVSIDASHKVRLMNESARALLRQGEEDPAGRPLAEVAPELAALLERGEPEAVVQLTAGSDARTLAVKVSKNEGGQVLTFDDITQQLTDQRRAAWSDVARRIAHEIKNPLTPIQLAAERLQRRYGRKIDEEDSVFARLTDTIVRQVSDLRRIVDEFSSFARMPKPLFRFESPVDIARQALFLHEVAHPAIAFNLESPEVMPTLVCDRRQIGQALTNVIKNAVEAIEARGEDEELPRGEIVLSIVPDDGKLILTVADNGVGLPVERDRIIEPYMTTRSRGTGLGLAIVKKIMEEHFGTIGFADRAGGGTVVTMCFDSEMLATMATEADGDAEDARPAVLTRTGNTKQ